LEVFRLYSRDAAQIVLLPGRMATAETVCRHL
jgi:hypothetical protein